MHDSLLTSPLTYKEPVSGFLVLAKMVPEPKSLIWVVFHSDEQALLQTALIMIVLILGSVSCFRDLSKRNSAVAILL